MSVTAPRTRPPARPAAPGITVRIAGRAPPNLSALLPDQGAAPSPALRVREGLLQTPCFRAARPWLSLAVPDWTESALLGPCPPDLLRGAAVAARLRRAQVGGACWAAPPPFQLPHAGALALVRPHGRVQQGRAMLHAALARHDAARVVLLVPGGGWAALARDALARGGRVVREPVDPWPLLGAAAALHVGGDDDLALLGLVAGVRVHCHGAGTYAGWGATEDVGVPARAARRTAPHLMAAALLDGLRCADPFRARPAPVEEAIDQLAAWRRHAEANRGVGCLAGMSVWKRRRMREMFHDGTRAPPTRRTAAGAVAAAAARGGAVAVWSSRVPPGLLARAAAAGVPVRRVEDGFVRSVGLGCDFLPPCSVVVDGRGMYFDPSRPSDLEHLLLSAAFTPELRARGRRLIDLLVGRGVTKYNTGAAPALAASPGQRRILVPGQVADDASVRLGGGAVRGNLPLLAAVRAANPDAFILYKPHPDVEAGHRPGALTEREVRAHADAVVPGAAMPALVVAVDEVHTLTSLAGFEALLRGRAVVAYGQPFYAGWGLTRDVAPVPRRGRQLQVEELVAGALILYPRYHDPLTGLPCPPEVLIDRLAEPALWRPGPLARLRRLQGWLRRGQAA